MGYFALGKANVADYKGFRYSRKIQIISIAVSPSPFFTFA
jgi:hypothetical protein